jgi:hypothetical protein
MATRTKPGILRALFYGAWLTISSPRLWWRVTVAQTLVAAVAVVPAYVSLARLLDHSLENSRLTEGFDIFTFTEVLSHPGFPRTAVFAIAVAVVGLFVLVFAFLEGGILNVYWSRATDKGRGTRQEFYATCAVWFWRILRLALLALPLLLAVLALRGAMVALAGKIGESAADERVGVYARLFAVLLEQLLFIFVRLWHDMAQVHAVAEQHSAMRKSFIAGARLAFGSFRQLFTLQLLTSLAGWAFLILGIVIWRRLPSHSVVRAFVVAQATLGLFLFARLWQRAAQVAWYQRYAEMMKPAAPLRPTPVPIDASAFGDLRPETNLVQIKP